MKTKTYNIKYVKKYILENKDNEEKVQDATLVLKDLEEHKSTKSIQVIERDKKSFNTR